MRSILRHSLTNLIFLFAFYTAQAAPAAKLHQIQAASTPADSVYLVQQGDTYYSLSRRFSVPLDSLQRWNNNTLQVGQTLYLLRPAAISAVNAGTASSKPDTRKSREKKAGVSGSPSRANESTSASVAPAPASAELKTKSRILVIPFDPYLYFSDADYEIARQSHIPRQNVRHVFRGRLNAMLAPKGYETIHLLGGVYRDSVSELSRIYKSLSYSYQDNKQSRYNHQPTVKEEQIGAVAWMKRQKEKLGMSEEQAPVSIAQDPSKHFGVAVKDPNFFSYFNGQYGIDYYVFINQFEVKTVYENCLDRAAENYERDFLVHYSIYDSNGELVSGNKVNVPYQSNINDVQAIVSDNMPHMAKRVLADLPAAN